MPKILVADDNSNVQRTVTLALSDLGVEVVAVNNGEAAVRKLSDFTPDLILADIFMPVRNGYEVCEFVKQAARFAKTPVVLLVGAFDPFDEREAQRVGADGILKKPFVPPDPLIAMVKTLLDRVMAERPVPAVVPAGPAAITQRTINTNGRTAVPEVDPTEETQEIDYGSRESVAFGEGERPVAFGDMFETPAVDVEASDTDATAAKDDSLIVTSKRDAALGDPGFWRKDHEEETLEFKPALADDDDPRIDDGPRLVEHPWESAIPSATKLEVGSSIPPEAAVEIVHEVVNQEAPTTMSPEPILLDAAAQADLTVDASKPADLAENPLDWMASAPPLPSEKKVERADAVGPLEAEFPIESPAPVSSFPPAAAEAVTPAIMPVDPGTPELQESMPEPSAVTLKPVAVEEESSGSSDEVVPVTPAMVAEPAPANKWADLASVVEEETKSATEHATHVTAAIPALVATVAATPVAANLPQATSSDPAVIEAVVQRVMEKMSPQVIDIITREFLRPVVQALVKREIEKH